MQCWVLIIILYSSTFLATTSTSLTLEQRVEKLEKEFVSKRHYYYSTGKLFL